MRKFFITLVGFALMASATSSVYSQTNAEYNEDATNQNGSVSELRLRQSPVTQPTTQTFGIRDYSQWSLFLELGLNQFHGNMSVSLEPTFNDPLRHFTVGGGIEYTFNPFLSVGLGYNFHRYGMFDNRGSFHGRMHNIYPFVGVNLLNFPMFNRNSRWDLWAYAGFGASHFNTDLTNILSDAVLNSPAWNNLTQAQRDDIIYENNTRWTGVVPIALELSFCITRQLALSLRAQYFMFTSDDLEGQEVKRNHGLAGPDRWGRRNYNFAGVNNDHLAALTLGLRWNITPRDRTHMRKVRWEDFVPQDDEVLEDILARLDELEDRVDDVEARLDDVEDDLTSLFDNLPRILDDARQGVGVGVDGQLPIPPVFIFFDLDRHNLRPDALKEVLLVASILNSHPDIVVDMVGLTDIRGSVAHNDALSIRRANEVRNELVYVWGICPTRITHEGRGKATEPDPTNPRYFQINRRVEVRFFRR